MGRDLSFSRRLNEACDGHPHIPPYGQGRQTWVKEHLDVSHEAVRKWFTGDSRPRPSKMRQLATALEVDEAWLALGITPDLTPKERKAQNARAEGATNVVAGLIQLNGGHIAFPGESDPRSDFVDIYAIIRGVQYAMDVALGQEVSEGMYKFVVPRQYDQCMSVGVVLAAKDQVHMINLKQDLIDKHKVRQGGYFELTINQVGDEYRTGSDVWPRVRSFI